MTRYNGCGCGGHGHSECNPCTSHNEIQQAVNDALALEKGNLEQYETNAAKSATDAAKEAADAAESASAAAQSQTNAETAAGTATQAASSVTNTAVVLEETAERIEHAQDLLEEQISALQTKPVYFEVSIPTNTLVLPETETVFNVRSIYVASARQDVGYGFTFDKPTRTITLAEEITADDIAETAEGFILVTAICDVYSSDDPTSFPIILGSNAGAGLVGTSLGKTVQQTLDTTDQFSGAYEDGPLTIASTNHWITYNNERWYVKTTVTLPLVTTGNTAASWVTDSVNFYNPTQGIIGLGDGNSVLPALSANQIKELKGLIDKTSSSILNAGGTSIATDISNRLLNHNLLKDITMYSDKGSVLTLLDGSSDAPNSNQHNPPLWIQKHTSQSHGSDRFAHNAEGAFIETVVHGNGKGGDEGATGTRVALWAHSRMKGKNVGTDENPSWDAQGNTIGSASFARCDGSPGVGNIVCGSWSYAFSPSLTSDQISKDPGGWMTTGIEVNLGILHPDLGFKPSKASTCGVLLYNYPSSDTEDKHWTYGIKLTGGSNATTGNAQGFHSGIHIDNTQTNGIDFGSNCKNVAIQLPYGYNLNYGLHTGNQKIGFADFGGSSWNNGDLWQSGGSLYYRTANINSVLLTSLGVYTATSSSPTKKIRVKIDGVYYNLLAEPV